MIKRTLYFGNPAYLRTQNEQLIITIPDTGAGLSEKDRSNLVPIEDIGVVILDHQQITISQALIAKLLDNKVALITCDATHHPTGLMLNLDGNTLQAERFAEQISASLPLRKNLWMQTVEQKIKNQAAVLFSNKTGDYELLIQMSKQVRSGDPDNFEGRAAAQYWKYIFGEESKFTRDREGDSPNHLLNYGYAILRAITARALVGSGLLPTLGIHHRNKYNAYCLADDIMEPYRPFVDQLVCNIMNEFDPLPEILNKELKSRLLSIPVLDVFIAGERSPLMIAMQRTTASLYKCFSGESNKIIYPILPIN
ncbi:type II CRISPR-associated endonuclease Cas1 [Flavobacterium filum]|uniref:type II CRISPR-associated endonuclease Cas1 n=1 Tax=Flavobacterium filum TaxID=370974 RepID=UPI0023F1322F|nr:type II CRISPR-associated endonuclease Cas1 [Flavobacterium filum]